MPKRRRAPATGRRRGRPLGTRLTAKQRDNIRRGVKAYWRRRRKTSRKRRK